MSSNLKKFREDYIQGNEDRVVFDLDLDQWDRSKPSPFIVIRQLGRTVIINPLFVADEYTDIDVHAFVDGEDASTSVIGFTDGKRVGLEETGTKGPCGWSAAGLVALLVGDRASS